MKSCLNLGLCVLMGLIYLLHTSLAVSYEGYQMFAAMPETRAHVQRLQDLSESDSDILLLSEPVQGWTALIVSPDKVEEFQLIMESKGVKVEHLHGNVKELIDATLRPTPGHEHYRFKRSTNSYVINHNVYHQYSEIEEMLHQMASLHPHLMSVKILNHVTTEAREVLLVKLHGTRNGTEKRPVILIEAGIHAREWISPAVNIWLIDKLLKGYNDLDPTVMKLLDNFDWYIIPVANPDGYEFTHTEDRMWRKNRRTSSAGCQGVDLNRNFNIAFNTTGVSPDCTSERYPGTQPFSEAETANVRDLVHSLKHRLVAYLAVHSFSQVIILPWTYVESDATPDNYKEMFDIAALMAESFGARYGTRYKKGQAHGVIGYAASGTSEDWVQKQLPGIFTVTIELRPGHRDHRGFMLPPREIVPTAEEYFDSLVAMANALPTLKNKKT